VVAIGDIKERGLGWELFAPLVPAMVARGAGKFKAILLKSKDFSLTLSKETAAKLAQLNDKGKSLLSRAGRAKSKEQARAIIDRGLKGVEPPSSPGSRAATGVATRVLTGQVHHPISKVVHDALEKHKHLRGKYKVRDPRFKTRAITAEAHRGYQEWHRELDKEVAQWINTHTEANEQQFETWLRARYRKADILARFPEGF
jgi:hypothetical protein